MGIAGKILCASLLFCLAGFLPGYAPAGEEKETVDLSKAFLSELIDKGITFSSRDVFSIQGTHVSSPHPDGYRSDYNSYDKVAFLNKAGDIIVGCTFEPGMLNTPDLLHFRQQKAELAAMTADNNYGDFIIKKASSNEGLMDETRVVPDLKIVEGPRIAQNTDRSIITVTDLAVERYALSAEPHDTVVAVMHGYIVFRNRSYQFMALADRHGYGVDGEALFMTWINKFLEWNK